MSLFGPPNIKKLEASRNIKNLVNALSYEVTGSTLESDAIKIEARDALVRIGSPAVEELLQALNNPSACLSSVITLGRIGDVRAVEPLINVLHKGWIETWVIEALASLGDQRAVEPIIGFAKNSSTPDTPSDKCSIAAINALGELGDPRAVNVLNALLKDDANNDNLRAKAAKALDQIGIAMGVETFIANLAAIDDALTTSAESELTQIGVPAIGHVLNYLFKPGDPDGKIDKSAGRVFANVGEPAEIRILYALKHHHNWNEAGVCIGALGWIGSERSLKVILSYINHQYRSAAFTALGQIGDERVVKPLIDYIYRNSDDHRAVSALGKVKDHRALNSLILALKQSSSNVRMGAAIALGNLEEKSSVEALIAALNDDDFLVWETAAKSLGKIKDIQAVTPLITALQDNSEYVVHAAAVSLAQIGDKRAIEPLTEFL
ncbi:MAG: HEAT repeat domain-containing protein [Anaerolineales bacterium]